MVSVRLLMRWSKTHIMFGAGKFELASLALGTQTGHVGGQVTSWTFDTAKDWRCVGSWAGHVQVTDLTRAVGRDTPEGDELVGAWDRHVD